MQNGKVVQAVLFDLDGVLVDACEWHYEALNAALAHLQLPVISREAHLTTYNGLPTKKKLELLGHSQDVIAAVNRLKQQYTIETIIKNGVVDKEKVRLHQALKDLGVKIACVTNSIRETATLMLETTGQLEYMNLLVSNEEISQSKPSPDGYNKAVEALGVDPSCCLIVEDSPHGLQAAVSSNVGYVLKVRNPHDVTAEKLQSVVKNIASNTLTVQGKIIE